MLPLKRFVPVLFQLAAAALCLAPVACSQATAPITEMDIDAITRTSARIIWKSTRSTGFQLLYGESPQYGSVMNSLVLGGAIAPSGRYFTTFLSGLKPGTTYYVCPQTTEGEISPCDGQRNNFRFTTLAGDFKDPVLPQTVEIGQPELTGQVFQVRPDCADLQQQIDLAARANPELNHEVRIPAGTLCHGQYTLPPRTGPDTASGWITLRPDITDDELPPQGVAINPSYGARMPVIRSSYVSVWYWNTPPETCVQGDFWWKANENNWALFRCADPRGGPKWDPIPVAAAGTAVPTECNVGDWFHKTNEPDRHKQAWWCLAPNAYYNVYLDNGNAFFDYAALFARPRAHHYRMQGIQLTHIPLPPSYTELFNSPGGRKKGALNGCLAYTHPTTHHITYDRTWFRGQGFPSGLWYAFCMWDGAHQAIVNSYFNEVNRWVHPETGEDDSRAINIEVGPGPGRVENNTFENVVGITLFVSDDAGDANPPPSDYTVRRNRFLTSDAYNAISPQSNGRNYYRRHHLELKRGIRFLVEGNVFDGGWTSVNQGASVVLTPRTGPSFAPKSKAGITDFLFRHNVLRNTPEGFLIIGHTDSGFHQTLTTQRVGILNNLFYGISSNRSGWPPNRKATGQFLNMGLGIEDLKIQHNTIYNSQGDCCFPNFLAHAWNEPNGGLDVRHNIFTFTHRDARVGIWLGGSFDGADALNRVWKKGPAADYTVTNNVLFRPGGDPGNYPRGNYFVDNAASIGFDQQLRLSPESPFKAGQSRAASDGADMGADVDAIKRAANAVENIQVAESGGDRVVLSYQFHTDAENAYCAADLSEKQFFYPFNRYWDNGRAEGRLAELTGLAPGSTYYLRLQCGAAVIFATLLTEAAPATTGENALPAAAKLPAGKSANIRVASFRVTTGPLLPAFEVPAKKGKGAPAKPSKSKR